MINIYISDNYFSYNGTDSGIYGLKFAWIDTEQDMNMSALKTYNYIKDNSTNSFKISHSKYESPHEFKIGLVAEKALTEFEVRKIYQEFFNHNCFKKLEFTRYNGEQIHINCVLANPERIEGSLGGKYGTVGFNITVICDAPWGWTRKICYTPKLIYKDIGNEMREATIEIFNNSDINDYIYPDVEFKVKESTSCSRTASFSEKNNCKACSKISECEYAISTNKSLAKAMIINESDTPKTGICVLANKSMPLSVYMKPKTGQINISAGEISYGINQTNKKFFRLVPGKNTISVTNIVDGTLKITYREARVFV